MRTRLTVVCALSAALLAGGLLAASASSHHKPSHKRAKRNAKVLRAKLHNVRVQLHEKRVQIHEAKKREGRITDEIEAVEARLLHTEGHLRQVKSRLKVLAREQVVLVKRIAETQARLQARKRILSARLRDNYEMGRTTYVQVLLKSRSVHDYMSRSYYVERIVDSDVKLVSSIRADQRQLEQDKKQLDAQAEEQKSLRANLESETEQYHADVHRKQELLAEVQRQREAMEEEEAVLEGESHHFEDLIRAAQETPRGRERYVHAWTGHFIKPANGPVTSGFGSRYHPILHRVKMHTGIDIGAGYGATIRAAAGGEVIHAGYTRGYGNCVIIDHGGGVSTLYGHCSELMVSEGQTVAQGQPIGRVGSTGLSTGPHLHFEVRHNGSPVDPRQ